VSEKYLGDDVRVYSQYLDADTGRPLTAAPGGSYEIMPAGGMDYPVPPRDGRWELPADPDDPGEDGGQEGEPAPSADPAPRLLMTGVSTEDEES
jgi:hypothetical protein